MAIDWNTVVFNMLTIKGIYGREMYETWYKMTVMLQSGLDIHPVITHGFHYTEFEKGFEVMRDGRSGKVILYWQELARRIAHDAATDDPSDASRRSGQAGLYKSERDHPVATSQSDCGRRRPDRAEPVREQLPGPCRTTRRSSPPPTKGSTAGATASRRSASSVARKQIHKQLEEELSAFLGTEDTILYASCFDANGGLFETLLGPEDAVISDQLNHASIIDGIRLCKAKRFATPTTTWRIWSGNCSRPMRRSTQQADHQRRRVLDGWLHRPLGRDLRTG